MSKRLSGFRLKISGGAFPRSCRRPRQGRLMVVISRNLFDIIRIDYSTTRTTLQTTSCIVGLSVPSYITLRRLLTFTCLGLNVLRGDLKPPSPTDKSAQLLMTMLDSIEIIEKLSIAPSEEHFPDSRGARSDGLLGWAWYGLPSHRLVLSLARAR